MRAVLRGAVLTCFAAFLFAARNPWSGVQPQSWTAADVERILNNSPWAQSAEASFPDPRDREAIPAQALPGAAQAGMASSRGATDGRWDGGVGYNRGGGLPTLHVLVRWESAEIIRLALARSRNSALVGVTGDYVLAVEGLLPTKMAAQTAKLDTQSSSDDTAAAGTNTEQLLENFMSTSKLASRSESVRPRNVQIDSDSGTVRLFFPRSLDLSAKSKEAYFSTRYGSLTVRKRFRLSDMNYQGHLAL